MKNIFEDPYFKDGMLYAYSEKDPEGGKVHYPGVLFPNVVGMPFYRITHWWTKHPITDFDGRAIGGDIQLVSAKATNVILEGAGQKGASITLDLSAQTEYGGRVRGEGEGFPHLLLECFFRESCAIGKMDSFRLSFDVMIEKCKSYMSESDYNPDLHCAHTSAIFAIENSNPGSKSFGQYFWFIVPVYDSRYALPLGGEMQDGGDESQEKIGTGMFIYALDGDRFWTSPVYDKQWHTLDRDILPMIKDAFHSAQRHGYLKDASLNDMRFKSFNFGWEITGNFDGIMKIRNLKGEYQEAV